MNEYDVRRLALILSVQAEIEAIKAHNATENDSKYSEKEFWDRAEQLKNLASSHNEQL